MHNDAVHDDSFDFDSASAVSDQEFWDGLSVPAPRLPSPHDPIRVTTSHRDDPGFAADWTPTLADITASDVAATNAASAASASAAAGPSGSTNTLHPDYVASLHLLSKFPASEHEQVRDKLYRDADGMIRTRHRLMRLVTASIPPATYQPLGDTPAQRTSPPGMTVDFSAHDDDTF